jgi:hypothetical protein
MTNGNGAVDAVQHIGPQPSPVTFGFAKIDTPDGATAYVLELCGLHGRFVAFLTREAMLALADGAREITAGLTIARDVPPE